MTLSHTTGPALRTRAGLAGMTCLLSLALTSCYQPAEPDPASASGTGSVDSGDEPAFVGFPLASFPPNGSTTVKAVGSDFANGSLVVMNHGEEDLRILSVEPELTGGGLEYLGAQSAGEARTIGYAQEVEGWPADGEPELGPLRAAAGTVVPANDFGAERGVEILLGFRVAEKGRSTVKGVSVRYAGVDSGEEHEETFVSTLAVCTPPVPVEECEPEYAGH